MTGAVEVDPPLIEPGPEGLDLGADLRHVDTWIFDLDNTLYASSDAMWTAMDRLITDYMVGVTGLDRPGAYALQKRYLHEHGATLAGLMADYRIDPHAYLEAVHDVPLEGVAAAAGLRDAIARLPGRRLVFTNASAGHADRVLRRLGVHDLFEHVFHLQAADLTPKPQARAYESLIAAHGVTPKTSCFFEDTECNLEPAAGYGMTTVLVGPHAEMSDAPFVDYRAAELTPFLQTAHVHGDPL